MLELSAAPLIAALAASTAAGSADAAEPPTPPALVGEAKTLLKEAISFQSVEGSDAVLRYAEHLKKVLVAGGFPASDVEINATGPAPWLVATYQGTTEAKPIILSGHMDVVPAKREDWTQDPFVATETDGFVIGRGAVDNKFDVTMMVATLVRLKKEGFNPSRDIVLALSGDEETTMASTQILAERFKGAELVLNGDGGGGALGDGGAAQAYYLQGAEKTYADFEVTFTNPGGHSSAPRADNAIYDLAEAARKIGVYKFPVQASDITRGFFRQTGATIEGDLGAAMLKFAENPADKKAAKTIAAHPEYVGQLGTTCVATMLSAGHAPNALPQRASMTVNCRIFPGVAPEDVRQTLIKVIADPDAEVKFTDEVNYSDASPLRDDVVAAVRTAIDRRHPGLPIVPAMSSGASDSLHFRAKGVPSYGVSGLFMKPGDDFSHGLNERAPIAAIDGALDHWRTLIMEIAK